MSKRELTVVLHLGDEVVASRVFSESAEEAVIGRNEACDLVTPADNRSVSKRHARVYRKGDALYIEDLGSRNGVVVDGKGIDRPTKLLEGSVYRLGECLLTVESKTAAAKQAANVVHRLEFLTGERAGMQVEIRAKGDSTGGAFTIGLDEANDIVLPDHIVSRRHASLIVRRSGDCFIRDLGSSNGTYVNGERLDARERFLRNGDKISIAYFDFIFHDWRAKPIISIRKVWRNLGIVVAVVGILGAGWLIYDGMRPSAKSWRDQATKFASDENFAGAFLALTNAYTAHGTRANESELNDALSHQLKRWKRTDETWQSICEKMAAGKHGMVREDLEHVNAEPANWTWNGTSAVAKHREAEFALDLIHRLISASDVLRQRSPSREMIEKGMGEIDEYLKANDKTLKARTYLSSAVGNMQRTRARFAAVKSGLDKIDQAVSAVGGENPDFAEAERLLVELVDAKQTADSEAIRNYAEQLLPTCRKFMETTAFLKRERDLVLAMDFSEVHNLKGNLPLPDMDACARNHAFSSARSTLTKRHELYQNQSQLLAPMVRNLAEEGISEGEVGSLLKFVCSDKSWDVALTFDCFKGRFPEPSRADPNSVYDSLAGIECTYESLHALPKPPSRQNQVRLRFIPKTQKAKVIFEQIKTFRKVMDRSEALQFRQGALGDLYGLTLKILEMRDELVTSLKTRRERAAVKGQPMNRTQLLAGFFAEYFADEPSYAELRALESGFKANEVKVRQLNELYENEPDPEKRLKIRDQVVALGIPGSEAVRKRWVELED